MTSKPPIIKKVVVNTDKADDKLVELVEALLKIDITKSQARLNKTSISDNNGGRITL